MRPWSTAYGDSRVIDASDMTVMPGLMDLSVQQAYVSEERVGRQWAGSGRDDDSRNDLGPARSDRAL